MRITFVRIAWRFMLISITTCSVSAYANMTVYPMSVGINSEGEGRVQVISKTSDVQYVKTTVLKIVNPGTTREKEVEVPGGTEDALVVMPPKFAVPGGASKLIRFVTMEPVDKEVMYRVMFQGVPVLDDADTAQDKTVSTQLNVNLVWGVLVSVPPQQPVILLNLSADKKEIVNRGTQRVKIFELGLCHQGKTGKQCKIFKENKNIFPDESYQLPNKDGYSSVEVSYRDWIKKENKKITLSF